LPRQIESLLRHYANGESRLVSMQEKFDEATALQSRFDVVLTETPSEIVRESPGKSGQVRTSSNGATSGLSKAERLILTVLALGSFEPLPTGRALLWALSGFSRFSAPDSRMRHSTGSSIRSRYFGEPKKYGLVFGKPRRGARRGG
jgi:hypothetical protein